MRSYIAFLLLALFSVSSLSAQLYDNRSRYLRAPYDDYDDRYEDRRETHHQPKTNYRHTTNKYRRSYYSYHKNVRRHTRPYLDVDELYREFRDPDVYYRYKDRSPYSNNKNPDEPKFKFNCYCSFSIDIASLINWFGSQKKEIEKERKRIIDGMEEEYLKELNERYPSYRKETSFEKAQKDFFKRYVGKFNSWYSQGEKVTYSDYQKRFVHKLSERLEVFETALEPSMASSKVVSELKKHRDRKANLNIAFGDLKINNKLVREMPSSQYRNYDLSYGGYRSGVSVVQKMVSERDLYKHFSGTSNNLNDYMSQQYINQYKKEDNLEERFALMSAYLVDMKENSYRPPSNKIPPKGFMHHVPYDFDDIYKHYYKSIDDFGINSLISFSKAKALVAIINYPDQIKKILEEGGLKGSAIDYFKNAVPVNYELNTIENAVLSRIKNQAFNWDELKNLPYYNHQNSKNPEVVMSIDLRKRTFLNFHDRKFFDVDIVLNGGLTLAEYNMHKGIGEVLNDLYNNSKYWYAEGATIRHFLKAKGVNIPNSLSNYNLGKLFDFGGGNTNTLTIQFSDFAKKYIKNFHHGDGIYGTSLFTDIVKFALLKLIADQIPVDFAQATKPCPGDPVPNPEIAPQKGPSGILGGMYGCTRYGGGCVGQDGRDKFHGGIDLKANYGDPIYAMYDGFVYSTGYDEEEAGYMVLIQSTVNGETIIQEYFHLQDEKRVGLNADGTLNYVKAGDIIGYQGDSGNLGNAIKNKIAESHVHLKIKKHDGSNSWNYENNFNIINPKDYLHTHINNDGTTGQINNKCN